ncbi:MAG: immunoglobulin domain-containing protein, partial [Opitutales bacterium]|nr:immunoglobulin domain-containing protein [Opitutales bacterium]
MRLFFSLPFFLLLSALTGQAAHVVPYTGKVSIRGVNYFGDARFSFSLEDGNGTTHWRNGEQPEDTIEVSVRNGRYTVLLGGQGMRALPPQLFLQQDELYLRVKFDNGDGAGLRHLQSDHLITSSPRALVSEWAKMARLSQGVSPGAITRAMLSQEVLSDLNDTAGTNQNATIGRSRLSPDVLADLNQSIKSITRDMLPASVLADLNRTVTSSEIAASTITTAQLNEQILKYLKPEITLAPQAPGLIFNGQTITLQSRAEGKYLNYQWYKDEQPIGGA